LAESLSDVPLSALYCSPILRARQTAEIVADRLHIPVEIEEGLREYDVGILEGKPYSRPRTEIYWQVVLEWMEQMNPDARIEGGESYNDIRARFVPFVRRLEEAYGQTEANILAISHGGTLRCMLPLLLSNVDPAFTVNRPIGYTTSVIAKLRDGEWMCTRWGEEEIPADKA
jgi:probable phosphoglycerate mutase